jgi:hydrogenase maturation protein HypF
MAASHLRAVVGPGWTELPLPALADHPPEDLRVLDSAIAQGLNAPLSSSCGRLFDAAAAILGFRGAHRYSAQAPMELEALAAAADPSVAPYPVDGPVLRDGLAVLQPASLLRALLDDSLAGRHRGECALAFHRGLSRLFADATAQVAREQRLRDVFLTGGCVQNAVFVRELTSELRHRGLSVWQHRTVPPNDGGISFGQAAWALAAETVAAA